MINNYIGEKDILTFSEVANKMREFCLKKGFVEVHTQNELGKVLDSKAEIIGINNRNLDTLEIDLNTTLRIANKIPSDKIIVSESGIKDNNYINKIRNKVNAILVGSAFMNSNNIENEIISLISRKSEIFDDAQKLKFLTK